MKLFCFSLVSVSFSMCALLYTERLCPGEALFHGTCVTPSGRLLSLVHKECGSRVTSVPVLIKARHSIEIRFVPCTRRRPKFSEPLRTVPMVPDLMPASSMLRERWQFHCPRRHGDELHGRRLDLSSAVLEAETK